MSALRVQGKRGKLSDVGDFLSGGTPSKNRADFWGGDIPWVTVKDMKSNFLTSTGLTLTSAGAATLRAAPMNAILMVVRGMSLFRDFPVTLTKKEVRFNQDIKALIVNDEHDPGFILLQLEARKRQVLSLVDSAGHGTGRLETDQLKALSIVLPEKRKQQEIAAFLGSVDAKLHALYQQKDGLERFRTGLMQKIFSQEVRFTQENGSSFPEWEDRPFGSIADISKGQQVNRDTLSEDGAYPVINGGTGPSGFHVKHNTPGETITISEGGNSCGYVSWQATPFWCGGHCYAVTPANDKINKKYLYQVLKFMQTDIMRLRVGSGLPNIQKGDLTRISLPVPHPGEQSLIARGLDAFDEKITAVADQIVQMETFKNGLLQRMFA